MKLVRINPEEYANHPEIPEFCRWMAEDECMAVGYYASGKPEHFQGILVFTRSVIKKKSLLLRHFVIHRAKGSADLFREAVGECMARFKQMGFQKLYVRLFGKEGSSKLTITSRVFLDLGFSVSGEVQLLRYILSDIYDSEYICQQVDRLSVLPQVQSFRSFSEEECLGHLAALGAKDVFYDGARLSHSYGHFCFSKDRPLGSIMVDTVGRGQELFLGDIHIKDIHKKRQILLAMLAGGLSAAFAGRFFGTSLYIYSEASEETAIIRELFGSGARDIRVMQYTGTL